MSGLLSIELVQVPLDSVELTVHKHAQLEVYRTTSNPCRFARGGMFQRARSSLGDAVCVIPRQSNEGADLQSDSASYRSMRVR